MSARDRAFSRLDRESLQEAIEANNEWAKDWVRKREKNLVFLEQSIEPNLISEAQDALSRLPLKLDFNTQQEAVRALWDLSDTLSVWYQILQKPRNVKVAVVEITKGLNQALDELASAGVWTRRNSG
jgi:hypothetical protein